MPATVLIVEDERDGRELLAAWLHYFGYHTLEAESGEAALSMLRTQRPAVIVLDIRMPGMDGWEFRRRQLADPGLRAIPVIVVSAEAPPPRVPDSLLPVCYFTKPFDASELAAAIRQHAGPGPS